MTAEEVQELGFRVKFWHLRTSAYSGKPISSGILKRARVEIRPTGGATLCELTAPNGSIFTGMTQVHPQDNYAKSVGRAKSLGRAWRDYLRRPEGV